MKPKRQKTKFWTVLTLGNLLGMMYPVHMYVNAYTNEGQGIAAIAMVGMALAWHSYWPSLMSSVR